MKECVRRIFALTAGVLVAGTGFGANLQWKVAGCDLYQAVQEMPAANDGFQLHQTSGELTFTLSDDATIENLTIDPRTGTIINLDFAKDGDHTLSLTKSLSLNPNGNGHINFIGGVYNLSFGTSLNRSTSNATATFDGAQFTMPYCFLVEGVKNSTVTFTNNATVTVPNSTASLDPRLYVFYGSGLSGARLVVSGGSKLTASGGNEIFYEYLNAGTGVTLTPGSASALFTGEGTELKVTDSKRLLIGYGLGGIETTFADHAKATAGSTSIGCSANVSNTKVTFTDNAVFAPGSSLSIGTVATADGNELTVSDGATLTTSGALTLGQASNHNLLTVDAAAVTAALLWVGSAGSHNAATFRNATLTVGALKIGSESTSSNNTLRIIGRSSAATLTNGEYFDPFGPGKNNAFVVDDCALDLSGKSLELKNGGNALRFENGASLTVSGLAYGHRSGEAQVDGLEVRFGNGAVANLSSQFFLAGHDNRLVLSNGTFNACDWTPSAFYFGRDFGTAKPEPSARNMLVLQGESPLLTSDQDAPVMQFMNSSVIRFELPPTGYAEPSKARISGAFSMDATCSLEITGVEELQHNQGPRYVDYVLIQSRNGANIGVNADAVAAVNATLPEKCTLTHSGDKLVLRVRAIRDTGMTLIFR